MGVLYEVLVTQELPGKIPVLMPILDCLGMVPILQRVPVILTLVFVYKFTRMLFARPVFIVNRAVPTFFLDGYFVLNCSEKCSQ